MLDRSPGSRAILVIEDDPRFATILRDLAHELGFQCIVTHTASDGLAAAMTYRPSAVLLDINLPDHSGLGVLDELKHNPETRHIPVHVASVADYAHEALERGAIGYALKPVKREQLVEAFRQLEAKFSQSIRRVLVVVDDERQRESIRQLLSHGEVQIVVLHLPPEKPSLLVDIFNPKCALPVREAENKEPIEPGTVYFAPPDYHLLIDEGPALALSSDEAVHFSRPSIDVLFESAADVYGARLLGIILTGASEDGASGLDAVRRAGGCTIVQQPDTAEVSLMTEAALKRGPADFVLPLERIAELLRMLGGGADDTVS